MLYPYNTLSRHSLLNTFVAALHSGYLCLKILATFGIVTIFGSQKKARNIEHGFILGHKNVHFLREEIEQHEQVESLSKQEASVEFKKAIEVEGDFKKVALDPMVLDRAACLGTEMSPQEQVEL
jgi:hypothetical protein